MQEKASRILQELATLPTPEKLRVLTQLAREASLELGASDREELLDELREKIEHPNEQGRQTNCRPAPPGIH